MNDVWHDDKVTYVCMMILCSRKVYYTKDRLCQRLGQDRRWFEVVHLKQVLREVPAQNLKLPVKLTTFFYKKNGNLLQSAQPVPSSQVQK